MVLAAIKIKLAMGRGREGERRGEDPNKSWRGGYRRGEEKRRVERNAGEGNVKDTRHQVTKYIHAFHKIPPSGMIGNTPAKTHTHTHNASN